MDRTKRLKDAKRLLTLIALMAIMVVALNVVVTVTCRAVLSGSAFRFSRVLDGNVDVDALVIGNSRGVNLLTAKNSSPGFKIFNLSYNGLGRPSIIALAKEYFLLGNKAHVVVVEASGLLFSGVNCDLKPYWGRLRELSAVSQQHCGNDWPAGKYFPLTLYNSNLFLRVIYYATVHRHSDQDWTNNYRLLPAMCRKLHSTGDPDLDESWNAPVPVVRKDLAEFESWLSVHAPGTRVIYVMAPFLTTDATKGTIGQIDARAKRAIDAKYLDMAGLLGGNCSDFADVKHINGNGRSKVLPDLRLAIQSGR